MKDPKLVEASKPVGAFYRANEGPKSETINHTLNTYESTWIFSLLRFVFAEWTVIYILHKYILVYFGNQQKASD